MSISKIDADREIIDHGLHEVHTEVTAVRLEKYVEFAEAVREWATTTTEGIAAATMLRLLEKVDSE
jgi:hypothetical protein